MRKEKESPYVRIGTAPGVEFPIERRAVAGLPARRAARRRLRVQLRPRHGRRDGRQRPVDVARRARRAGPHDDLARSRRARRFASAPARPRSSSRRCRGRAATRCRCSPRSRAACSRTSLARWPCTSASGCCSQQIPVEDCGANIDLASLEDTSTRSNSTNQDDPPPPEEEDKPDDGEDESGGTGTAMALDEGKMGKKDSDRAEGQYKMQKNQEDPQLARQQAIEQARNAGILGSTALDPGWRVRLADRHRRHLQRLRRRATSTAVCSVTRPAR